MRARRIGVVIALVAVASCSDARDDTEVIDPAPVTQPSQTSAPGAADPEDPDALGSEATPRSNTPAVATPAGPAIVDGAANSLVLVHDIDGGDRTLVAYRADGTEVANYSDGAGELVAQPIWSPDGRRVAWVRSADGATWEVVTVAADGGDRTVHPLPGRPDYITYDPTVSRLLALTPSPDGFGLVIIELDPETGQEPAGDPFEQIDLGVPYFSDFAPAGDRLVAHVATDVRIVDLTGEKRSLALTAGTHQTPLWHPIDNTVFYTADTEDGEQLISRQLGTEVTTELGEIVGFVLFDIDPAGEQLAVVAYGNPPDSGLQALRRPGARRPMSAGRTVLDTGLWIIDVGDGRARLLDDQPSSAPIWDPTGSRVLVRDALGGAGRWKVLGLDGTSASTELFDIDRTLVPGYLPFWDQYVRSQTVWSPDGAQFVHVGRSVDGTSGVWIHDAATSGPSTLLAEGEIAFWSPT
jgi:hypothetical protein